MAYMFVCVPNMDGIKLIIKYIINMLSKRNL